MSNEPLQSPLGGGLIYCQRAKDLLDALADAIRHLVTLHEAQFQAVISGDSDSSRFDDLIHLANERKHDAKYAYMEHLESHGCSIYVSRRAKVR